MNAEALIGTVLGTCKLQQVIGQGGMGAVYLAQQSRPRRQVAVKVLLPITPLPPNQLAAFLERFRRETDAVASLEHPNIIPVYEYDEYNGLAYLVMPFISGGTLRDVMDLEGALPLPKVVSYLEQLAAALDFAHERGVIHRDIKPANILLTPQGRLLLTDFGLVKVSVDGQEILRRLTGPGAPVGTPDYMSPEQVLGEPVDGRADLYSLGVILYQMVTGTLPFHGETPMQVAAQHLQVPPNSPRLLRPDLPVAAEQVMLRVMAKRPTERYARGRDLVNEFLLALASSGTFLGSSQDTAYAAPASPEVTTGDLPAGQAAYSFRRGSLFDPAWQTGALSSLGAESANPTGGLGHRPAANAPSTRPTGLLSTYKTSTSPQMKRTNPLPAAQMIDDVLPGTLSTTSGIQPAVPSSEINQKSSKLKAMRPPVPTGELSAVVPPLSDVNAQSALSPELNQLSSFKMTTGSLAVPGQEGAANTIKLTGPVKVVQVPIAGQPGRYVTGLLPVPPMPETPSSARSGQSTRMKIITLTVAVLLVLAFGAGAFWLVSSQSNQPALQSAPTTIVGTPNVQATLVAQATATVDSNIILSDPLSQNIHNWPNLPTHNASYAFTGGAYHITNLGTTGTAVVLQDKNFSEPIGYTLTMQEIKGDDTSLNNSFGMIIRSSVQSKGGRTVSTFYSFEVVNTPGGEYRFYKYDDSKGSASSPWTELWHQGFGSEFHQGHGPKSINTFKIFANGSNFIFTVNGKQIGHTQDRSLTSGGVGMLVNLKGTEVAFSNMLITRT
jgi:serine/threonine protein kinase